MLTAFGSLSRNRSCGIRLVAGERLEDILSTMTVEGVPTAQVAVHYADMCGLDLPLFSTVHAILEGAITPAQAQQVRFACDPPIVLHRISIHLCSSRLFLDSCEIEGELPLLEAHVLLKLRHSRMFRWIFVMTSSRGMNMLLRPIPLIAPLPRVCPLRLPLGGVRLSWVAHLVRKPWSSAHRGERSKQAARGMKTAQCRPLQPPCSLLCACAALKRKPPSMFSSRCRRVAHVTGEARRSHKPSFGVWFLTLDFLEKNGRVWGVR